MLHRVAKNSGQYHRFISHINFGLKNPLKFNRPICKNQSLLERSIIQYLLEDQRDFCITQARESVTPYIFRDKDEKSKQENIKNKRDNFSNF